MDNLKELKIKKRIYTRIMDVYRKKNVYIPFFHPLIRFILKLKIVKDFFIVNYLFRARPEEIVDWFQNKKIFFVFAVNRYGPTFLANFLSRVILDSLIEHEANVDDYWFYTSGLKSEKEAEKYIRQFRLAEIYYRVKKKIKLYGEINPFLRRHCQALQKALPDAKFFHLVRGGRKVVRSLMSRGLLGKIDPIAHLIKPPTSNPHVGLWESMTHFEKVYWLWQVDNRYLRKSIGHTLQF